MFDEWKRYPVNKPKDYGDYLCVVLIPDDGGGYNRAQRVLYYEAGYVGKWHCEGMIVTHWQDTMCFPKDQM